MVPVKSLAWHDSSAAIKAVTALYRNQETVQKQFAELAPQQACHPDRATTSPMNALASIVCFAEGELISSFDFWGQDNGTNPSSVWNDGDGGYLFWPGLTVIAGTDSGLEIYLRRTDSYGAQHYCIREVGDQFIKMTGAARYRNN